MSRPKVVIEFVALLQTDDIPYGLSIEITPKTFILHNLDILLVDGLIEVPLNVQIRSLEKVNGGEFFQGFSQINDKLTYQYQIPLTTNGNGHKAIKASINFCNESKSTGDMEKVLMQMSKIENILELNRSELTDIKETLTDMVFTSHPPSEETIETEDFADGLSASYLVENIDNNASRDSNQTEFTLLEIISKMKKREEAYGDDAERNAIFSDPGDKIWTRQKNKL